MTSPANRQQRLSGNEGNPSTRGTRFGFWENVAPWVAAVASGGMLASAYPPLGWEWAAWIGLVPLALAVWLHVEKNRATCGRSFALGWVSGAVFFLLSLSWITEVTVGGWLALAFYCALYFGLFGIFLKILGEWGLHTARGPWVSSWANIWICFFGAGAWAGLETLRGFAFTGFGWNGLGVALWRNVAMIQIADVTGVVGVSFVVCAVNLCFAVTVLRLREELRCSVFRPHYDFVLIIGGAALVFVYGVHRLMTLKPDEEKLKVAAVQPNIPQEEKWDVAFERKILEKYRLLSEYAAMTEPDLLAWPEAAMPRAVFSDREVYSFVLSIAERLRGDFLLGTVHFDVTGDYNSIVLLAARRGEPQFYHKIHLVPFGEYVPFRHSFPLFAWIVGELVPSDFDAGREPVVFQMGSKDLRIGPLVCFEDTLGNLARQFVQRGAEFFVNVTNDGWFRRSAGSEQHLAQAVFRSVENRVPMLRVANTGVTCWIDLWGRVTEKLTGEDGSTFVEGVMIGEFAVPKGIERTFYTQHGELFGWFCAVLSLLFVLAAAWQKREQFLQKLKRGLSRRGV